MIIPEIRQPEYQVQTVVPTSGLDMTTDQRLADPRTLSDCADVQFDNDEMKYRDRFVPFSSSEQVFNSGHVKAIGSVSGTFWRVLDDKIQSYSAGTWTTKATVSVNDSNTRFRTFFGKSPTAEITGTTSGTSSSRVLSTTGLSSNAHAGKILKITSGAASGQSFMITGNTATAVYVSDTFDTIPASGVTFEICAKVATGYFTIAGTAYKVTSDASVAPTTGAGAGNCLEVHKERLFGTAAGKVTYSVLGNGDFGKTDNFVPIGSGQYEPMIRSLGDSLRIYTPEGVWELYGDGPENFQLSKRSDRGLRDDYSFLYEGDPENCVHDQFFISNDGIESSRRVEAMNYEPIPTSYPIFKSGQEIGRYAHLAQKDGRLYLFNNFARNGGSETSAYVYDTQATSQKQRPVWSRVRFPRSVSCSYYEAGVLYLGIGGIVLKSAVGTADYVQYVSEGTTESYVTTQRLNQKDMERPKTYYKARVRVTVSGKGTVTLSAAFEGGAFSTVRTLDYDVGATETEYDLVGFIPKTKKDVSLKVSRSTFDATTGGAFRLELFEIYYKAKTKVI